MLEERTALIAKAMASTLPWKSLSARPLQNTLRQQNGYLFPQCFT
jgi:hypothetical protein